MKTCTNCGCIEMKRNGLKKGFKNLFDDESYYWICTKCGKDYDIDDFNKGFTEYDDKHRILK